MYKRHSGPFRSFSQMTIIGSCLHSRTPSSGIVAIGNIAVGHTSGPQVHMQQMQKWQLHGPSIKTQVQQGNESLFVNYSFGQGEYLMARMTPHSKCCEQ
jgi:hypothetical protein